ncbi:hypothetical protein [Alkalicoccobacillus gibsonii]|uniref:hypothetical protein n=1 Tax=Alkalicoccobacillus gibsonii TaxID=79881 RepID=UPI001933594C|nr:hypothetical protein [Alkalicoccobacillus gibsonii]MBM0067504.1 hypothetical protein [Alkalicoccobacillus gibsonii]
MWPNKEKRKENRKKARERQHWSTFLIIGIAIFMNNGFILESNRPDVLIYTIIGIMTGLIPLFSIWHACKSLEQRRRLATKEASEVAFTVAALLFTSIFIGLFHETIELTLDRLVAGTLAVCFWIFFGIVSRVVYKRLLILQNASAVKDKHDKKTFYRQLTIAGSAYVVFIFVMFYWIF